MSDPIRLQKFLSSCGIASRRHSEKLIKKGFVCVNGQITTKMGTKIDPLSDEVYVSGKKVQALSKSITLMLNKPAGYVSTMIDPQNRACVADLVPCKEYPNLFPVGRLDRLTCGLLIFTTDGKLGNELMHPSHNINKTYSVVVKGCISKKNISFIEKGVGLYESAKIDLLDIFEYSKFVQLENEFFKSAAVKSPFKPRELLNEKFSMLNITIHEGKNRQIRKMFAAVGLEVLLLKRLSIENIKLDNLEIGKWRKIKIDSKLLKGKIW